MYLKKKGVIKSMLNMNRYNANGCVMNTYTLIIIIDMDTIQQMAKDIIKIK
jgi:hypothetical protein